MDRESNSTRLLALPKTWGLDHFENRQWYGRMTNLQKKIKSSKDPREFQEIFFESHDIKIHAIRRVLETGLVRPEERKLLEDDSYVELLLEKLDWQDYECDSPVQIKMIAHASGSEHFLRIPTLKDQAMEALISLFLSPIVENSADPHSYGPHSGKNICKLEEDILESLHSEMSVMHFKIKVISSEQYYRWLRKHLPISTSLLDSLIEGGLITSELFPKDQYSIRLGIVLTPLCSAFALTGLEELVEDGVSFFRYETSCLLIGREESLKKVRDKIKGFLFARGLNIIPQSVYSGSVRSGFDFLSKHFYETSPTIFCVAPSKAATTGLLTTINDIVWYQLAPGLKSRAEVISEINNILTLWRYYHSAEIGEFQEIDRQILQILVSEQHDQSRTKSYKEIYDELRVLGTDGVYHPKFSPKGSSKLFELASPRQKIQTEPIGRRYYSRELSCCALCGRQIYYRSPAFQIRTPDDKVNLKFHKACAENFYETIQRIELGNAFKKYNYESEWEEMRTSFEDKSIRKVEVPSGEWSYRDLYRFFLRERRSVITLTFSQIEEITGFKLPREAYRSKWYWSGNKNLDISDSWTLAGYELSSIDIKRKKARFISGEGGRHQVVFPKKLQKEVPLIAKIYYENFMRYIIDKYYPES